ncbi:MAG: hypothetical protein UV62_C0030G0001, partial [Parcubacteria group bacterium GW2011_GWC1_43_11]
LWKERSWPNLRRRVIKFWLNNKKIRGGILTNDL